MITRPLILRPAPARGPIRAARGYHIQSSRNIAANKRRRKDMVGLRVGDLTVVAFVRSDRKHGCIFRCQCVCGSRPVLRLGTQLRQSEKRGCRSCCSACYLRLRGRKPLRKQAA